MSTFDDELTTGTQALIEFLKNTSPEEFQRGSSAGFFKKRQKPSPLSSNVREFLDDDPPPSIIKKKDAAQHPPPLLTAPPRRQSSLAAAAPLSPPSPMLPSPSKRHELSSAGRQRRRRPSVATSTTRTNPSSFYRPTMNQVFEEKQDAAMEAALRERVAHLEPAATAVKDNAIRIRHRHIQTQTMPVLDKTKEEDRQANEQEKHQTQSDDNNTVEQLKRWIAEEQQQQKRLQTALHQAQDQFEVLSGLAYIKLREIWEEKVRWETACFELQARVE